MGQAIGKAIGLGGEIPKPFGPYRTVGTLVARPPGCPLVQVFYPADEGQAASSGAPYFRKEAAAGLAQWMGMAYVGFVFTNSLAAVKHPFKREVKLHDDFCKKKALPIVLFSHGLGGNMEIYAKTCADIASHGYLVVAMEHEDGSGSYSFPESENAPKLYQQPPKNFQYTRANVAEFRKPFLEHRRKEVRAVVGFLSKEYPSSETAACDTQVMIMDKMDKMDNHNLNFLGYSAVLQSLLDHADQNNIFLAGHSFGGASTVYCSTADPFIQKKVKACVLLDLWPFPLADDQVKNGMAHDTLSVLSEQFVFNNESPITLELKQATESNSKNLFLSYYLEGTMHQFCSDTVWWTSPKLAKKILAVGDESPRVSQAALISAIAAFLKGNLELDHISTLSTFHKHHSEEVK